MSIKREPNHHRYSSHPYRDKQELEELADARIITKNLVYIIGLSSSLADKAKLSKYEYLGQYGQIIKTVVNKNKAYNQNNIYGPSYSAYVTYSKPSEASIAILSLDNTKIDNHLIRASFGTTKYCSYYLKGIECSNKECLFLHRKAEENDIIKRGDLTSNKIIFAKQHEYAEKIADIYNPEVKKKIMSLKKGKTVFPSPDTIYENIDISDMNVTKSKSINLSKSKNNNSNLGSNNNSGNKKYSTSPYKNSSNMINNNKYEKYQNSNEEESYEEIDEDEEEIEEEEEEEKNEENNSINDNNNKNIKNKKNEKNNITSNNNNISKQENIDNKKNNNNAYLNREKSRFDFCEKAEKDDLIKMPKHILELINKKINLYNLTKYMQPSTIDKIFLKETINKNINNENTKENDEWTKFINDNIDTSNYNNNDESINEIKEINDINNFILKKVTPPSPNDNNK
jgi:CCR4-NOT transcription complex subunit 4